jgi:hypothetical protein
VLGGKKKGERKKKKGNKKKDLPTEGLKIRQF